MDGLEELGLGCVNAARGELGRLNLSGGEEAEFMLVLPHHPLLRLSLHQCSHQRCSPAPVA